MVSFDAAAMYGPKFEDFGTWLDIVSLEEFRESIEEQPEVWWINITSPYYKKWWVVLPSLTPVSKVVSKKMGTTIMPNEFVVLTQPNFDKVLILFSSKNYFMNQAGYAYTKPYYLQEVMLKQSFIERLLVEPSGKVDIKVLTETRNFGVDHNIKLLNWMDARSLLEYTEISENPLRPFLWYLELKKDTDWKGHLTKTYYKPYGITDQFSPPQNYYKGLLPVGKDGVGPKNPDKAWEIKGHRKTMSQWVGDEKPKSSYSSETYKLMMAHTHPKGLCPICNGPIPNQEHKGQYPGALSRFDNETEVCSVCGSAEAMGPMMSEDAREFMQLAITNDDWGAWVTGVRFGREQVEGMMKAQKKAHEELKEMGMTEHKVFIDGEWVDVE